MPEARPVIDRICNHFIRLKSMHSFNGNRFAQTAGCFAFFQADQGNGLPGAASHIYQRHVPPKGTGLYTNRHVESAEGQPLVHENPLLVWLCHSATSTHCQQCVKPLFDAVNAVSHPCRKPIFYCQHCKSVLYCSRECAQKAWRLYHHRQCKSSMVGLGLGRFEFDLRARFIFQAQAGRQSFTLNRFVNKDTFFSTLGSKERICFALAAMIEAKMLHILGDEVLDDHSFLSTAMWLLKFKIVDNINSFVLERTECDSTSGPKSQKLGHIIYLTTSMINHSCEPNCLIEFENARAVVRPKQDLKVGQELLISYLPGNLLQNRPETRRLLKAIFYFDCQCGHCRSNDSEIN